MRARSSSSVGPLAIALGAGLLGCRTPTSITVETSTELSCAEHGASAIVVGPPSGLEGRAPSASKTSCDSSSPSLGRLVLVPSGGDDDRVGIKAVLGVDRAPEECLGDDVRGCVVARRTLRYVPHTRLTVAIALRRACVGVRCAAGSTCVQGACVAADIADPTECAGASGCDETVLAPVAPLADAGAGDDATSTDAGPDVKGPDGASPTDARPPSDGPTVASHTTLALGEFHSCALTPSGAAYCWGANDQQQLGRGGGSDDANPAPVLTAAGPALARATGLVAGRASNCATFADGHVACWGQNGSHQLGPAADKTLRAATTVDAFAFATSLTIGDTHSCFRGASGAPFCVGANDTGQLGMGSGVAARPSPSTPPRFTGRARELAASSGGFTLAVREDDGAVWGWGRNDEGEVTPGAPTGSPIFDATASQLLLAAPVARLAAGSEFACVALTDGSVSCWGDNHSAQCGVPTSQGSARGPTTIVDASGAKLASVVQVAVGGYFACALLRSGHVQCWGSDDYGQLGRGRALDGGTASAPRAADVVGVSDAVFVACGAYHACAVTSGGQVLCWGGDSGYQLGQADGQPRATPSAVDVPK